MTPITVYVADEDYERVIIALGLRVVEGADPATITEAHAKEAISGWIQEEVMRFEDRQHRQGFVFVPPGVSSPEPWVQPTGAHDAYTIGDVVLHNEQVWKCVEGDENDLNVWEPGVFGWEVI